MKQRLLYESYNAHGPSAPQTGAGVMRERIRSVLILVLLAGVIVLGVLGGQAMAYRAEARETFIGTIQAECDDALTLTNSLSRTAGASSSGILGRIRSHVHAMDTLNQINVGLEGGDSYMVSPTVFTELYTLIDNYTDKLRTGMITGDLQTELLTKLTELSATVNAIR